MNVAIYARVSTEEQVREGHSIAAQVDVLKKYCQLYGYEVYKIYSDEGISGKDMNRPELQSLLKDADEGKFDILLVWKISRLSRSLKDMLTIVDRLSDMNVAFHSYSERFDTSQPVGKMTLQILGSIAEFERNTMIENVKLSISHKQNKGEWHGGPIYGYRNVKKRLVVDEVEANIVSMIYRLFVEGYSTISIASKLNDAGIRTRKNNPWTPASIYLILKNETYTGVIRKGVKKSKKYETIHGLHTPIIERSIYDEVQRIFRKRYRRAGAKIYR